MFKRIIFLAMVFFLTNQAMFAQTPDLRRYIGNIVDIDGGIFGFIVGSKGGETVYFVTASQNDESITQTVKVRFFRTGQVANGVLVRKFQVQNSQLYLYAAKVTSPIKWEAYNYNSLMQSSGPFFSYLDNGKLDSLWYINSSPIALNEKISNDIVQLKVARDDVYHQGMPVIDGSNRVVGLIAQKQEGGAVVATTINMQTIAKKLDEFSKCSYFQMIAYGQSATPCEVEKKIIQQDVTQQRLARESNQVYPIAIGPSFSVNYNLSSGVGEYGISAFGYSLGANIYFRPDEGRFKVTAKPRYTYSPLGVGSNFPFNNSIGYRAKSYRIRELEMPVMLEWITRRRTQNVAGYLGLGYIPGYQFPYIYRYTTTNHTSVTRKSQGSMSGMIHKLGLELGVQGPTTRISFIASYQLTPWYDPDYYTTIENKFIYPTRDVGLSYLLIGIDVGIRLKGNWGFKTK